MGREKEIQLELEERGFGISDKFVCANCFEDEFIKQYIYDNGKPGHCSFCIEVNGKQEKEHVLPIEDLMQLIMETIQFYYVDAEEYGLYDKEDGLFDGLLTDTHEVLSELYSELIPTSDKQLDEMKRMIIPRYVSSWNNFEERMSDVELANWTEYCNLVNDLPEEYAAEQIVYLCRSGSEINGIDRIARCLESVVSACKAASMTMQIKRGTCIYRAVGKHNDIECNSATFIGTAPPKYVKDSRMSECGDMMFYGASSLETALVETKARDKDVTNVGIFRPSIQLSVLNLARIEGWKPPSVFDLEKKELREAWYFANEFANLISSDTGKNYRPTQVFTKYIQRTTHLSGVAYNSVHSDEIHSVNSELNTMCYSLFISSSHCVDAGYEDLFNKKAKLLVMDNNPIQLSKDEVRSLLKID